MNNPGWIPCELVVRSGEHIVNVEIPPFKVVPTHLVWGTRFFQHKENLPDRAVYQECEFTYFVPGA